MFFCIILIPDIILIFDILLILYFLYNILYYLCLYTKY